MNLKFSFNEKYTQDIKKYLSRFEELNKRKEEEEVEGVTFHPKISKYKKKPQHIIKSRIFIICVNYYFQ